MRIDFSRLDSDPDPHYECGCGSGSNLIKITHTYRKNDEISCFAVLDVLLCGLEDSPLAWTSFMEAKG